MNIKQYRIFDLVALTTIGCLVNFINFSMINSFLDLTFNMDVAMVIVIIALYRWGWRGIFVSVIMTVFKMLVFFMDASWQTHFIAIFTSITMVAYILWFKVINREKTQKNGFLLFMNLLYAYLIMVVSNCVGLFIVGQDVFEYLSTVLFAESLNFILVYVVLVIAAKQHTILIDVAEHLGKKIRGENNDK